MSNLTTTVQSLPPPPDIAACVSSIWVMECESLPDNFFLPLVANGYPAILFQTTSEGRQVQYRSPAAGQAGIPCPMPQLTLCGQYIQPAEVLAAGSLTFIACFLHPHMLHPLFGYDAKELTGLHIDMSLLPSVREMGLTEQLMNARQLSVRLTVLYRFIARLAARNCPEAGKPGTHNGCLHRGGPTRMAALNNISYAASAIRRSEGLIELKTLQKELSLTERTLQRLFEFHIGTTPRMFGRICQFNAAFQHLNQWRFGKLSDIAFEYGYADQSHFARAFREFTGYPPGTYVRNCAALGFVRDTVSIDIL